MPTVICSELMVDGGYSGYDVVVFMMGIVCQRDIAQNSSVEVTKSPKGTRNSAFAFGTYAVDGSAVAPNRCCKSCCGMTYPSPPPSMQYCKTTRHESIQYQL